ncbi:relaxase/mobilization nuclease domain-containing protein [Puia dinghuensis]|uniref:Mobilization protein n=1 Tax=Puia dinghuensis TaxID=1792502 RepID=A0A8J2UMA8_9BACT|nr:relaxase/mobilization nuclease domain-containing protein [Puia dinghuensis]GGB26180.1 mobilization protein [Puia dinghuensis]
MVVRIRTGKSIRGALSYNERKVTKGNADLLLASGFSCEVNRLGFSEKLRRFELLTEKNKWVQTNTLHLSLNFSPKEQLSPEKMQMIALDYMNRIGFGEQPFLVYRHRDANHPHIHIITTNIQKTGRRISLHNIGRTKSEPARKAIEEAFNLVKAETAKKQTVPQLTALELLPAKYGKEETKQTITNILGEVLRTYKFSNLMELNVILRQRNVLADRGPINSRMYNHGGLVYSLLDKNGFRTGIPIKASNIYGAPILKMLEKKFAANAVRKLTTTQSARNAVSYNLTHSRTIGEFSSKLQARNIFLHFDKDIQGNIETVYFVDHKNKATYSNEELNIPLSDLDRLTSNVPGAEKRNSIDLRGTKKKTTARSTTSHPLLHFGTHSTKGVIDILLRPEFGQGGSSGAGPKKKKKRRKPPL